jgi:hypothetical protein
VMMMAAWCLLFVAIIVRVATGEQLIPREMARDLFLFGLLSWTLLRTFHWPGKWMALAVMAIGAIGISWYGRDRYLASNSKDPGRWLLYLAVPLVLVGALFKIQHWPYSGLLLVAGFVATATWFIALMFAGEGSSPGDGEDGTKA